MPDPNQCVLRIIVTRTEIVITSDDCNASHYLKGNHLLRAVAIALLETGEDGIRHFGVEDYRADHP